MKIAMLVLATIGYYVMLFFLNKRRKTAFKKNAITVLGDTTNLETTETDLLGNLNSKVDSETLSELTALIDADKELASNMTNMIEDTEAEEVEAQDTPIKESDIDGLMSNIISKQE